MQFIEINQPQYMPVARVLRSERKHRGFSQVAVGRILGLKQYQVSRLEKGQYQPNAYEWIEICSKFQIPADAVKTGLIDRGGPIRHVAVGPAPGNFHIPEPYSIYRASKNRSAIPYLKCLAREIGADKLPEFFEHIGVDIDFMWDLDAQINIQFIQKVIATRLDKARVKPEDIAKTVEPHLLRRLAHSQLNMAGMRFDLTEYAQALAEATGQFDINYEYSATFVGFSSCDFIIKPSVHIEGVRFDSQVFQFIDEYKREILRWYFKCAPGVTYVDLREIECLNRGGNKCVYRISVA